MGGDTVDLLLLQCFPSNIHPRPTNSGIFFVGFNFIFALLKDIIHVCLLSLTIIVVY